MTKTSHRHHSMPHMRIAVLSAIVLVGITSLGVALFIQSTQKTEQDLRKWLRTVAILSAQQFNGDDFQEIHERTDMSKPVFVKLVQQLNGIRDAVPKVEFTYIFRQTDDPTLLEFVADADALDTFEELDENNDGVVSEDEEGSYPGDLYEITGMHEIKAAFSEPMVDEEMTQDQWGTFISSYAPIYDSTGVVVGIVGMDVTIDSYTQYTIAAFPPKLLFLFFGLGGCFALYISLLLWTRWENQRQLRTLMSNLPGMAYRCLNDEDWTMHVVSNGCAELTGYTQDEVRNNAAIAYAQLIHPEDRDMVWSQVQAALQKEIPFRLIYRIRTKEGFEKWVWEQGQGVFSSSGKLIALEGFITDITELKRVDETKSQFLAAASHKLRTPLTGITWSLEMLQDTSQTLDISVHKQLIESAKKSAEQITDTINTMLRVSTLETGGVQPDIMPTAICTLLQEVCSAQEGYAKERSQALQVSCTEDISLHTDPSLLQEILTSLIQNAIMYSPKEGDVHITASRADEKVCITVQDHGCGIPKHEQYKVFQKFFRAQNAVSIYPDGAGLDLYLAHTLVGLLEGDITFISAEGSGSTFSVELPL